jgi:Protein of unknown function (DUF3775)
MLNDNEAGEIRRIAQLAQTAGEAQDRAFVNASVLELDEPHPPQAEGRPVNDLGLAALPDDEPRVRALRDAIEGASDELKRKLWAVSRIGSGDYSAGQWDQAIEDAALLPHSAFISELADEADLHDRLMKGLYELGIAEPAGERS